ncbi:hypothetical protein AXFE_03270 [Acidithrix ferrooxidans]|uniref:Helix-turn-helix domain of resolvase n=2 Tax=Acidithrix ferrooxidans TaxID=1280514 RepID=A0A0D8HI79_9ACTN|nr:hypothetical protein AXFE_16620 [Acidithrix ferrooxidans]KJF18789.1 hypothetical protein AXFE_03270 [Acidithrix ferrooxidans]
MLKGRTLMNLIELRSQGHSYHEISKLAGVSRNTVAKYVRDGAMCETKPPRAPRGSKLRSSIRR